MRPRHGLRRRRRRPSAGRPTRGSKCTGRATASSSSGPTPPTTGSRTSTSWSNRSSNNGGRSCVNASGVWVTRHARRDRRGAGRAAVARRRRAPADDPERRARAVRRSERRRADLARDRSGAGRRRRGRARRTTRTRLSAAARGSDRVVTAHGGTYLLPTVVRCDASHPLANREYPVPVRQRRRGAGRTICRTCLGPSLVVTCISSDPGASGALRRVATRRSPEPRRIPTTQIGWDQPHEGNLFDHLYARRAIQRSPDAGQSAPLTHPLASRPAPATCSAAAACATTRWPRSCSRAGTTSPCCRSTRRR